NAQHQKQQHQQPIRSVSLSASPQSVHSQNPINNNNMSNKASSTNGTMTNDTVSMEDSIPEEPASVPTVHVEAPSSNNGNLTTAQQVDKVIEKMARLKTTPVLGIDFTQYGKRPTRASTRLMDFKVSSSHNILSDSSATNLITGACCGGGCCKIGTVD